MRYAVSVPIWACIYSASLSTLPASCHGVMYSQRPSVCAVPKRRSGMRIGAAFLRRPGRCLYGVILIIARPHVWEASARVWREVRACDAGRQCVRRCAGQEAFAAQHRAAMAESHPGVGAEELAKLLACQWQQAGAAERAKAEAEAARDQERCVACMRHHRGFA